MPGHFPVTPGDSSAVPRQFQVMPGDFAAVSGSSEVMTSDSRTVTGHFPGAIRVSRLMIGHSKVMIARSRSHDLLSADFRLAREARLLAPDSRGGRLTIPADDHKSLSMIAAQIIGEIQALEPEAKAEVIRFAIDLQARQRLSGPELTALAGQLADAPLDSDVGSVREELERGFYGKRPGA